MFLCEGDTASPAHTGRPAIEGGDKHPVILIEINISAICWHKRVLSFIQKYMYGWYIQYKSYIYR